MPMILVAFVGLALCVATPLVDSCKTLKEKCPADSKEPARHKRYWQVSGKQGGFAKHEIVHSSTITRAAR